MYSVSQKLFAALQWVELDFKYNSSFKEHLVEIYETQSTHEQSKFRKRMKRRSFIELLRGCRTASAHTVLRDDLLAFFCISLSRCCM